MISSLCLWQIWAYHTLCFTYGLHICGIINIHHDIINISLNLLKERTFCKWYIKEILQKTVIDTRNTIPLLEASQILKFKDCLLSQIRELYNVILTYPVSSVNSCLPNPCKNDGLCVTVRGKGYQCKCRDGFNGPHCESKFLALFTILKGLRAVTWCFWFKINFYERKKHRKCKRIWQQ